MRSLPRGWFLCAKENAGGLWIPPEDFLVRHRISSPKRADGDGFRMACVPPCRGFAQDRAQTRTPLAMGHRSPRLGSKSPERAPPAAVTRLLPQGRSRTPTSRTCAVSPTPGRSRTPTARGRAPSPPDGVWKCGRISAHWVHHTPKAPDSQPMAGAPTPRPKGCSHFDAEFGPGASTARRPHA